MDTKFIENLNLLIGIIEIPTDEKSDDSYSLIYAITCMKQGCASYVIEHAEEIKKEKHGDLILAFAIINGMPNVVSTLVDAGMLFTRFHMFIAALFDKPYYFSYLTPDDSNNLENAIYESFNLQSVKDACTIYNNYPTTDDIEYITEYMTEYLPLMKRLKADVDYDGYKEKIKLFLSPPAILIE